MPTKIPTADPAAVAAWSGRGPRPKAAEAPKADPNNPIAARYSAAEARAKIADIVKKETGKKNGLAVALGIQMVETHRVTTGVAGMDYVFGGGTPLGHQIEISGWEGSGKTTSALTMLASAQREGLLCGFIDIEKTYDPVYAVSLGVDTEGLVIARPKTGEEALEILIWMLESDITIVVVDSIAAMLPRAEAAGDIGDSHMSLQARLMGQACRKTVPLCQLKNSTVIWLNQIRVGPAKYKGDSGEYTPGGNAMRFYASIRARTHSSKKKQEGSGDNRVGVGKEITLTAFKNKTAPEDRRWRFFVNYGLGFDALYDLVKAVDKFGSLEKKGSWYWLEGERLCNGGDALLDMITGDEELREQVMTLTRDKIKAITLSEQLGEATAGNFDDDSDAPMVRDEESPSGLPSIKAGPSLGSITQQGE